MKTKPMIFFAEADGAGGGTAVADAPENTGGEPEVTGFAAAFDKAMQEPEAKPKVPEPKVEAKKEPEPKPTKREVPASLFKKSGEKPAEAAAQLEPESEIDRIEEPKGMDEKSKKGWAGIKAAAKEHEKRARELEARLKETESNGDVKTLRERNAELEKQHAEMSDLVSKARIELHPEYRAKFIEGRQSLVSKAQKIVEESGGDPQSIATALNLEGKPRIDALSEIAENLNAFQSGRLGKVIDDLTTLDEEANAKRADSGKYWETLQKQDAEKARAAQAEYVKSIESSFTNSVKKLSAELEVINKSPDAPDWWKEQADTILKESHEFVTGNVNPDTAMDMAIRAHAMPVYRDLFMQERANGEQQEAKIKELQSELDGIYKTSPRNGGGGGNGDGKAKGFMGRFVEESGLTE